MRRGRRVGIRTRIDESHFNLLLAPSCRDKKWPRAVMELAGRSWRTRMQTLTPSLPENRQLTDHYFVDIHNIMQTLPKAQRTRGLRSAYQRNFLGHIASSYTNLNQLNLNFRILTKPSFRISIKITLHNFIQVHKTGVSE